MNLPQYIEFHGQAISTVKDEQTGKVYCVPRQICDNLRIDWPSQFTKLKGEEFQEYTIRWDIPTDSLGMRETFLLDIDALPGWLFSISSAKVDPAVKDGLIAYRRECYHVLRDYWYKGVAVNPRVPLEDAIERRLSFLEKTYAFMLRLGATERDKLMMLDQIRDLSLRQQDRLMSPAVPALQPGFSIAELGTDMGYVLTRKEQALLYFQAGKVVAREWRRMYGTEPQKEPRYVDGAVRQVAWYPATDREWIEPLVQQFMTANGVTLQNHGNPSLFLGEV